ncbi:MAG: IMP dehydrogenase [Bacilli bacterium]|nr:IMP dehydrogenase [Bacilli bacterium]
MERLLDFLDIALIPSEKNSGTGKYNFSVTDELDRSQSLPIFTSPMDSVVSEKNWEVYNSNGIKPVLPRTSPLNVRLEGCQYVFAAFSLKEVQDNFLLRKRISQMQFKVCIDPGNGHDTKIFELGKALKAMYGPQINLMGGNIGSPKVYGEYCKTGFDYVRVGMSGGSLVDPGKYGFYYPQASLLIDILGVKNTALTGLKHTKIISDGGIKNPSDILKAIALGADYVMIGREFAKLLEAAGPLFQKTEKGKELVTDPTILADLPDTELKDSGLIRYYSGSTSLEMQARRGGYEDIHDWLGAPGMKRNPSDSRTDELKVTKSLKTWLTEMYDCFGYGFTMSGAKDWQTFKSNAKFVQVQI